MTGFQASDPATWAAHLDQTRVRPEPTTHLTEITMAQFVRWNFSAGPIETLDTLRVRQAITRTQLRNELAPLSGRCVVIIDGPPLAGKTYAALILALLQTQELLQGPRPHADCVWPRAWVYIEAKNHTGAASIARAIARGVGAIVGDKDGVDVCLAKIRHMAPKVGLIGYIVDDCHGMYGARSTGSTTLATALKGLVTGIDATAVIIGANLERDGIFHGTAGEQIRLSARFRVMCGGWDRPDGRTNTGWEQLLGSLRQQLAFPGGLAQFQLGTHTIARELADGSLGRPGLAIDWVKEAAVHAITNETVLDLRALQATTHIIDRAVKNLGTKDSR